MLRGLKSKPALLLYFVAVPHVAWAQEQTVEGAQTFLSEVANRGSMVSRRLIRGEGPSGFSSMLSVFVRSARAPERCTTEFELGRVSYAFGVAASSQEGQTFRIQLVASRRDRANAHGWGPANH